MVQFPFPIDKCSEYSFNCDDNINQSFDESYNDPLKANGLCPLTTNEIRSLLNLENDYRITNEIHPMEKINSIPEKKVKIKNDNINEINTEKTNENIMLNKKRKLGRRTNKEKENQRTDENDKKCHNKYSNDNLQKKIKHISINSGFNFVNDILKHIYNKNQSKKKFSHQLIKLNYKKIYNTKVEFNRSFLENTIKWIFTNKVSSKYKKYDSNHNQILLEESLLKCNKEDKEKLELFLNMKYIEYLDYYRGNKPEYNEIFQGLVTFEQYCKSDDLIKTYSDHENYKKSLEDYLNGYEKKLKDVRPRKPKTRKI